MSEQTDKVVAEVLTKAMEAAQATGAFVVEQAPDVVQQLLLYYTVREWAETTLWATLGGFMLYKGVRLFKKGWAEDDEDQFMPGGILICVASPITFAGICNFFSALKITLAPKVWLLEYAARLVS